MKTNYFISWFLVSFVAAGCASRVKHKDAAKVFENIDFEKGLVVRELPVQPSKIPVLTEGSSVIAGQKDGQKIGQVDISAGQANAPVGQSATNQLGRKTKSADSGAFNSPPDQQTARVSGKQANRTGALKSLDAATKQDIELPTGKVLNSSDDISGTRSSKKLGKSKSDQKNSAKKDAAGSDETKAVVISKPQKHLPDIESGEGYDPMTAGARRPLVDPYWPGEKVTLEVSFFAITAGIMTVEVKPFVEVNGRKSYAFYGTAKSYGMFSSVYTLDDWFETYVDFEKLIPYSYSLHVKESKQLRQVRNLFDWKNLSAQFREKKVTDEEGLKEINKDWQILEWSQNVFSAVYYMRTLKLTPGKKFAFRIAHEGENLILSGEVLRKEHLSLDAGEFETVVVKPSIQLGGVFKPVGDILIWLTDDDRKFIVKIESAIKIGTIKAKAVKIEPGQL
jgi:hypothetical protein